MRSSRAWIRSSRVWMRSRRVGMISSRAWIRSSRVWMRSRRVGMRSSRVWMISSRVWMRSRWVRMRSSRVSIRSRRVWMRSSRVWSSCSSWADLQLFWSLENYCQQMDLVNWPAAVLEQVELHPATVPHGLIFSCSGAWRAKASSWTLWADLQLFRSMKSHSQLLVFVSWPAAVLKHEELQPAAVPRGLTFSCSVHGELHPEAVPCELTFSCSGAWRATARS